MVVHKASRGVPDAAASTSESHSVSSAPRVRFPSVTGLPSSIERSRRRSSFFAAASVMAVTRRGRASATTWAIHRSTGPALQTSNTSPLNRQTASSRPVWVYAPGTSWTLVKPSGSNVKPTWRPTPMRSPSPKRREVAGSVDVLNDAGDVCLLTISGGEDNLPPTHEGGTDEGHETSSTTFSIQPIRRLFKIESSNHSPSAPTCSADPLENVGAQTRSPHHRARSPRHYGPQRHPHIMRSVGPSTGELVAHNHFGERLRPALYRHFRSVTAQFAPHS